MKKKVALVVLISAVCISSLFFVKLDNKSLYAGEEDIPPYITNSIRLNA
jgi:hypothetical protein